MIPPEVILREEILAESRRDLQTYRRIIAGRAFIL